MGEETDSDNIAFSPLYGTTHPHVYRQNGRGWYREAGLSAPRTDRVGREEVGCPRVLLRSPYAGQEEHRLPHADVVVVDHHTPGLDGLARSCVRESVRCDERHV